MSFSFFGGRYRVYLLCYGVGREGGGGRQGEERQKLPLQKKGREREHFSAFLGQCPTLFCLSVIGSVLWQASAA